MKIEENDLFKRSKQGFLQLIFSRFGVVLFLLFVQVWLILGLYRYIASNYAHLFYYSFIIFSITGYLILFNSKSDNSVKLTWMLIFTIIPVMGILFYFYTLLDFGHRIESHRLIKIREASKELITTKPDVKATLEEHPDLKGLANFVNEAGNFPVYHGGEVTYFSLGEEKFADLLQELKAAQHFIFMEYFIVAKGEMWGQILEILIEKVKEGVEVRFMYDGFCEFSLLPRSYPKELEKYGIKCKVFAPIQPFISTVYNFRDHRKICVIDGQVAYTGGVNLADEYINKIERFGHWKDTAVKICGGAAQSFTLMFLQMWALDSKTTDFEKWLAFSESAIIESKKTGFVLPYGDSPLDGERVGEMVYFDLLNKAQSFVQIMTPYLILDGEMETALTFAAKRGVKVQIILPHIPDKKYAFALAKSHYVTLIRAGVEIYEYTPGFVHAKTFVVDGDKGTVGTINLDYRSFYHHFECGVYLEEVPAVKEMVKDFEETRAKSQRITMENVRQEKKITHLLGWFLKIFAPLM